MLFTIQNSARKLHFQSHIDKTLDLKPRQLVAILDKIFKLFQDFLHGKSFCLFYDYPGIWNRKFSGLMRISELIRLDKYCKSILICI